MEFVFSGSRDSHCSPVSCENVDVPISTISSMVKSVYYNLSLDGVDGPVRVPIPFNNAKYRAIARVTDFFPEKLEDFSYSRKVTEYDALSDISSEDDDEDSYTDRAPDGHPVGQRRWQWRFALQLEDASPQGRSKPERVWVYVSNGEAECLTDLNASK